ncbi:MAG: DEAD/DEAH box helicase [Bacteroidetes bacterium]|nr:DEAD/DEAH box helicase [Bacteroidota bacterium]
MTFENLEIIPPILEALKALGYTEPTPIQAQAIPILLQGRDLLGCAQTGTGKTCAFVVPILQMMHSRVDLKAKGKKIKALIITPTRELAIQIDESIRDYGKNLEGLRHTVIFGGVKQGNQTHELQKGIDILTATPGRLLDLMQQGYIHLQDIEFFVLDEADRMLDMGFIHDVRKVIAKLPSNRQSLYFSATLPQEIVELSQKILNNPAKVSVTPQSTTAERVEQGLYFVDKGNKNALLVHLLKNPVITRALVFSRTKHGANKIAKVLMKVGIGAEAIHGNKSQAARVAALEGFKAGRLRVLVATDIAARGIDIDDLSHVIQYDLPNVPETYVHRIGRTGRAGAAGIALAFCDSEERAYLRDIERLIRQQLPLVQNHPFPPGTALAKMSEAEAAEAEVEAARGGRGGGGRGYGQGGGGNRGGNSRGPSTQSRDNNRQPAPKPQSERQNPVERQPQQRPAPQGQGSAQGPRDGSPSRNRRRKRPSGGGGGNAGANSSNASSANTNFNSARQGNPPATQPKSNPVERKNENSGNNQEGFRGGISWD